MQPALKLDLIDARRGAAPVLGPLSLTVYPGETVAITGPSGIGKTTLLRILAGLHDHWRGTLDLPGRVAMVFQQPTLLPWRSALDNITLTALCSQAEALAALQDVDLADKAQAYPGALSLGQQRRLALARAFARQPQVLLMDEAFVSLDPALADEMMALFERLRETRPLATVMVTHVVEEAARLASRTLRLQGRPAMLAA
jgi:ABC-type nitrate/sulfonate/bicarbonate transport system ATPase subunit